MHLCGYIGFNTLRIGFTNIIQGYFTDILASVWSPTFQWINKISSSSQHLARTAQMTQSCELLGDMQNHSTQWPIVDVAEQWTIFKLI